MSDELPENVPMPATESNIALSLSNLGKCYRIYPTPQDRLKQAFFRHRHFFREFWALRNVSFDVHRGETVGIMGRNGCGKSTLLQMVCKTLTPTTGGVNVNGRVAALLELGAGFNIECSGRDNIYTNAAILGLSREEIDARYPDIVAFSELADFIDQPVKTFSSGMFLRLAFSVAISVDPDVLIVDEALAVGDEAFQRKCYARLRGIQKRGGTILLVTHGAGTIIELCNRAILLDHGEMLLAGEPKLVVAKYHKLIYAPADKIESIRDEIRNTKSDEKPPAPDAKIAAEIPSLPPPVMTSLESLVPYYDAEMVPKSTVAYASNGAMIHDPEITTLDGQRVNVLVRNQEYLIRYRVEFTRDCFGVRCGMLFKTVRGVELGGRHTGTPYQFIPDGAEGRLSFRFRCLFVPGTYFSNVGLMGVVDGRDTFLHRLEDALIFRVQHDDTRTAVAPVELCHDGQMEIHLNE